MPQPSTCASSLSRSPFRLTAPRPCSCRRRGSNTSEHSWSNFAPRVATSSRSPRTEPLRSGLSGPCTRCVAALKSSIRARYYRAHGTDIPTSCSRLKASRRRSATTPTTWPTPSCPVRRSPSTSSNYVFMPIWWGRCRASCQRPSASRSATAFRRASPRRACSGTTRSHEGALNCLPQPLTSRRRNPVGIAPTVAGATPAKPSGSAWSI